MLYTNMLQMWHLIKKVFDFILLHRESEDVVLQVNIQILTEIALISRIMGLKAQYRIRNISSTSTDVQRPYNQLLDITKRQEAKQLGIIYNASITISKLLQD